MRRLLNYLGFWIWVTLAVAGVAVAQFRAPDQRIRASNLHSNTINATTIQTGSAVPSSLAGLAGSGSLIGCQEGTGPSAGLASWDLMWCDSTYHGLKVNQNNGTNSYILSTTSLPTVSGQSPTFTTAGAFSAWQGQQGTLSWDGLLGSNTTSSRKSAVMTNAGHFTELVCTATLTGSCTTNPEFNVFDTTSTTSGTATTGLTTTVATLVTVAETLTFNAGDTVAIGVSSAGSTCTAPAYSCVATYTQP